MSPLALLSLAAGGGAIGLAVGCTGIGGVLLVPLLTYGLGLPVRSAIAISLWSYLWSGGLAVWLYARHGSVHWPMAAWLCVAAMPGAYLGARATALLPSGVLESLVAALLVAIGANALRRAHVPERPPLRLGSGALLALGGTTGFLAALLGAGGAAVLVPVLVMLDQPALLAIGLGQAIQLPIAALASLANLTAGDIDFTLGAVVAAALSLGITLGAPLAHALPQRVLRRILAMAMAAVGAAALMRLAFALSGGGTV